ncbi:MAG: ATP-binding protein [Desulfobacter sp.]
MTDFTATALKLAAEYMVFLDKSGRILEFVCHNGGIPGREAETFAGKAWRQVFEPVTGNPAGPEPGDCKALPGIGTPYLTMHDGFFIEWRFAAHTDAGRPDIRLIGAGRDVSGYVTAEQQLRLEKTRLIGRNKGLKCLYKATFLLGSGSMTPEQKFKSLVKLLPPAFAFPDIATAMLTIDGAAYASGTEPADPFILSEKLRTHNRERGRLEIVYDRRSFPPDRTDILFSQEERHLLKTVARQLSLVLEKEEGEERHKELERQLQHADRLATVGQLAAGIAHELNGPLNNILGYAQLAAKQQELPEQVYTDLDHIVRFSLHTREIVKKVMLFSRQMPPRQETVNLNAVIKDSLYFTEPLCTKSGVDVIRDLCGELPDIQADASQLHQVVVNLIVNAVQAMPDTGGTITITTGTASDTEIFMAVKDTGKGMGEDTLLQCFMPFFTTKDVNQGTGLGLSVVHGIVESHGGRITADSTPGKGTRFRAVFPVNTSGGGEHV